MARADTPRYFSSNAHKAALVGLGFPRAPACSTRLTPRDAGPDAEWAWASLTGRARRTNGDVHGSHGRSALHQPGLQGSHGRSAPHQRARAGIPPVACERPGAWVTRWTACLPFETACGGRYPSRAWRPCARRWITLGQCPPAQQRWGESPPPLSSARPSASVTCARSCHWQGAWSSADLWSSGP